MDDQEVTPGAEQNPVGPGRGAAMNCRRARLPLICLGLGLGLGLVSACGNRTLIVSDGAAPAPGQDRGRSSDASPAPPPPAPPPTPTPTPTPTPVPPPAPNNCIIAIRVDDCCTKPMPAFVQSLQTDPCLVAYPVKWSAVPAQCLLKQPQNCELIDCALGEPKSRVVAAIPGGSCNWMDECQTDADCVMATNYILPSCCPCPYGYPKQLLGTNACLLQDCPADAQCPPPPCPPSYACGMACGACPTGPAFCQKASPTDPTAKNRCMPWHPW